MTEVNELNELLDLAMYREIVSQSFYIAGQARTEDPGARQLMKELAEEELKHSRWIRKLKEGGVDIKAWRGERVPDLMISEYLVDTNLAEGVGLQDVLTFAIKREQQAAEFYHKMMGILMEKNARGLCEKLMNEELSHKDRLETLYDDMFYAED